MQDTPKTIAFKTGCRAVEQRKNYRIRFVGLLEDGGNTYAMMAVEHKRDPSRAYDVHCLRNEKGEYVPERCNCPAAQGKPKEHCKHTTMLLNDAGFLADDLRAKFDPTYTTLRKT